MVYETPTRCRTEWGELRFHYQAVARIEIFFHILFEEYIDGRTIFQLTG
jgi:hypothetical protein